MERCETGTNPLETRGKRKPVTPENDPRETGLSFVNGGDGGSRTRVHDISKDKSFTSLFSFYHPLTKIDGYKISLTILLR